MEKENRNTTGKFALIIGILALALSIAAFVIALVKPCKDNTKENGENTDTQYVLYLGTNDKDTNLPVYTPDESKEKAKAILIDSLGGYTIQEANGGWIGDDGTEYQEYTLVIHLSDTDLDTVHSVAAKFIKEFNQSSILIQSNQTKTEFYS